jgi:NADH-quinone oxidoreductase subunit E
MAVAKKTKAGIRDREKLLDMLREEQSKFGYVSEEFVTETAQALAIPVSEVYGVATFYSFLSTRPLGRNVIRVCKSVPCYLQNSLMIIDALKNELGIAPGETTPDGAFSLELTNCIGECDKAPAMLINSDVHGALTPNKINKILQLYK